MVARLLWEQDVGSSSLFTPTRKRSPLNWRTSFISCFQSRFLRWALSPTAAGGRGREGEMAQRSKSHGAPSRKRFWAPQEAAKPRMSGVRASSLRPKKSTIFSRRLSIFYPIRRIGMQSPSGVCNHTQRVWHHRSAFSPSD